MHRTKTCERCGKSKPATEMYYDISQRSRDRLKSYCRACSPVVADERRKRKNERSKQWYWANREKALQSARESWQRTRSDRLAYLKRYRAANKERIQAYHREYHARKAQA